MDEIERHAARRDAERDGLFTGVRESVAPFGRVPFFGLGGF